MSVKSIDHWVITAGDVDRTLAFYRKLGFEIVYEQIPGRSQGRPTIRINDSQKINVHPPSSAANPSQGTADHPSIGGADFCLVWEGTVQEIQDLLARNEITPIMGPGTRMCARGPANSTYIRDPDGNLVEFTVYEQ